MRPTSLRRALALAALVVAAPAACAGGGSDAPDDAGVLARQDAGQPGARCLEIVRQCHPQDDGTPGDVHDCHSLGHTGPESQCVSDYQRCIVLCGGTPTSSAADSGAGGSGAAGAVPEGGSGTAGSSAGGSTSEGGAPPADAGGGTRDAAADVDAGSGHPCADIAAACSLIDPGTGPVHDCVLLEGATESACASQLDRCTALCGPTLCIRMGSVCHEVDPGSGPVHDCHDLGHEGTNADCFQNAVRCLSLCESAAP